MSDALSPADVQNLMLLSALKTDDAMAERIKKLLAAHQANEDTLAQVREERAAAHAELEEARKLSAASQARQAEAEERMVKLAHQETGLGEAITTHNADVKAFNEIRAQIEADLKERTAKLEAAETLVVARSQALADREVSVQMMHNDYVASLDSLRAKHAELAAIIARE
jgi:chromosome segregation ATPase